MAAKTWTGSLDGQWNEPGNWSPAGIPVNGDEVIYPGEGYDQVCTAGPSQAVTLASIVAQFGYYGPGGSWSELSAYIPCLFDLITVGQVELAGDYLTTVGGTVTGNLILSGYICRPHRVTVEGDLLISGIQCGTLADWNLDPVNGTWVKGKTVLSGPMTELFGYRFDGDILVLGEWSYINGGQGPGGAPGQFNGNIHIYGPNSQLYVDGSSVFAGDVLVFNPDGFVAYGGYAWPIPFVEGKGVRFVRRSHAQGAIGGVIPFVVDGGYGRAPGVVSAW